MSIRSVAQKYIDRGHGVRIISETRIAVTDREAGNTYRVNNHGRAIVGTELAAELAEEKEEDPNSSAAG